jgi:hypothetical protein
VLLQPTPSGHYHLALSFARASKHRDLTRALEHAGQAVSSDPTEVQYWHLLGLLSAATEQWEAAAVALDTGAALDEDSDEDSENNESANAEPNGVEQVQRSPVFALEKDSHGILASSTLLKALPDHHPPNKHERWEHAIQLRMTRIAVSEAVEGAEGAAEKLREVFEWIAIQKGLGAETATGEFILQSMLVYHSDSNHFSPFIC